MISSDDTIPTGDTMDNEEQFDTFTETPEIPKKKTIIDILFADTKKSLYWAVMLIQITIILLVAFTPNVSLGFSIAKGLLIVFSIVSVYLINSDRFSKS